MPSGEHRAASDMPGLDSRWRIVLRNTPRRTTTIQGDNLLSLFVIPRYKTHVFPPLRERSETCLSLPGAVCCAFWRQTVAAARSTLGFGQVTVCGEHKHNVIYRVLIEQCVDRQSESNPETRLVYTIAMISGCSCLRLR